MEKNFTKCKKEHSIIKKVNKLVSLALALAMCLTLAVPAMAATQENISAPATVSEPRLSKTTVSKDLTTDSWVQLYTDYNWTDVEALITNNSSNPGSIMVKIEASDSGQAVSIGSKTIAAGYSWASPQIASSYSSYTVYVKAASKAGTYSITYNDI